MEEGVLGVTGAGEIVGNTNILNIDTFLYLTNNLNNG